MYISFGHKLRGLGNVRIGYRMKGSSGCLFLGVYGFLQMVWYIFLGTMWFLYGVGYVCYYLPVKGIVKLCKNKKMASTAQEHSRASQPEQETPNDVE